MAASIDYDRLAKDLTEARAAGLKVRHIRGQSGVCTTDWLHISLPRAVLARVEQAGRQAGALDVHRHHRTAGRFHFSFDFGTFEQGPQKTARYEAMASVMSARGWDAHVCSMID